jgi:hypothetical protein
MGNVIFLLDSLEIQILRRSPLAAMVGGERRALQICIPER